MGQVLAARREQTDQRLESLKSTLTEASRLAEGKACVYLTGSFGRGEASSHSDLDLFIVGDSTIVTGSPEEKRQLSNLDEICLKADLIQIARKLRFPDFSGDGEYITHYTVNQLLKTLGKRNDDETNALTARLLLLLESRPLICEEFYQKAIDDVIAKYWQDYGKHSTEFVPTFLANDILRLWRTFCVNYEARTSFDTDEKKAKRKLKNYKLKHSRLLTCYSALAYLLAIWKKNNKTVSPADAKSMVKLSPTKRLEYVATTPAYAAGVKPILDCYEKFLQNTDADEESLIKQFLDKTKRSQLFEDANQLGNSMAELLAVIGKDTVFYRHLIV